MQWLKLLSKCLEPVTKREVSLVGLIVLAYLILAAWMIGASSIWFDEAFGAYMIQFSYADIAYYTGRDVHPPLYYWFLKTWAAMFGTSDIALRGMSVLFGATAIISGYAVVRKLMGKKAALGAAFALAISPMMIRYGQEARMYTMLATLAFSGTYVLLKALETNAKKWWIGYALLLSAGMWTHYLVALFWLSHWVWRGFATYSPKLRRWGEAFFTKEWLLAHVLAVVLFLPWMPWLLDRVADVQTNGFWIPPLSLQSLADVVGNIFLYQDSAKVSALQTILVLIAAILTIRIALRIYQNLSKQRRVNFALLLSMAFVPPVLLMLASLPPLEPSFVSRYIVLSIMVFSLVLGSVVVFAKKVMPRTTYLTAGVLVLLAGMGTANVYALGNYNKTENQSSHAKQVIETIRKTKTDSAAIVVNGGFFYYEAHQYETPQSQVYFVDEFTEYIYGSLEMLRQNDEGKIKDFSAFKREHDTFWYIGRPGSGVLALPDETGVMKVESFRIDDQVTGEPAYQAIRYQTTVE